MSDKYFLFYENFYETAKKLPDDIRWRFYDALTDYIFNGTEPDDPVIAALVTAIKPSLEKKGKHGGKRENAGAPSGNMNATKQSKTIKNNQDNQDNEIKQSNNQNNQPLQTPNTKHQTLNTKHQVFPPDTPTKVCVSAPPGWQPQKKFVPPTLDEVVDYAAKQNEMRGVGGFRIARTSAEEFWAHYDSQGWRKSNDSATPVTNWQSALRLWAKHQSQFTKPESPDKPV